MRILIATGIYPPEIGGPATHTVLMEEKLPAFNHTITTLPFRVSRQYPKGIRHVHYLFRLWKLAKGTDIIFAQDVLSVGLPALIVARLTKKTFIVRVPGDYAWEQSVQRYGVADSIDEFQARKYNWKVELLRFLQKKVVSGATKVVTPSDYFNRLVCGWGVAKEKVVTIYNGVDVSTQPAVVKKDRSPLMVSAGRLVPWKGFKILIDILSELPDWKLKIIGTGPDEQLLKNYAVEKGVAERVDFTGRLPKEELLGWCAIADVFVLNTHFESFSYQIVEAMSVGAPIIATNVGSIPELITTDEEGVLVEPDDKVALVSSIDSVTRQSDKWETLSKNAKQKAQKFSVSATMQQLHALFTDIVA